MRGDSGSRARGRRPEGWTSRPERAARAGSATAGRPERPEHVSYWFLFKHVDSLKKKADELAQKGKKSSLRSAVKKDAELNDEQAQALESISLECVREVGTLDAKAKAITDEFKARYPGGRVPRGETLPPPPPELLTLQAESDAAVLRARDRLRASLGDKEFQRFDAFAKAYGTDVRITTPHSK